MVLEHQAFDQRKTFLLHNMPSIKRGKETVNSLYTIARRKAEGVVAKLARNATNMRFVEQVPAF